MDCSIMPTGVPGVVSIQTTDFFYPLVEDPYVQGMIACANVLSDLFSLGVARCDNMLMLLASSRDMEPDDRKKVTKEMMRGFNDLARKAGTLVTGGQTVLNPWPIIGGVASCVCPADGYVDPFSAQPGDVIVLTKPLGTQLAVNAHQWLHQPERWAKVDGVVTREEVLRAYALAMASMARLNQNGARLMRKFGAHGATDVTGFGFLGHAQNFAAHQTAAVDVVLHTLPVLAAMPAINKVVDFKLLEGFSAETSGGLLIALPPSVVAAFVAELEGLDGWPVWVVGDVVDGSRTARFASELKVLEI
eukprot:Amastigsp_a846303_22.p1 type:complete len:304 gc:universal Amastigsp_a846303_22:322-1233(+)